MYLTRPFARPIQRPVPLPRGVPDPLAALKAILLPGAAQLLIHPLEIGCMFQDRAGTQLVTAPGQLLGRVRDIGGGGYDAVAVSDAARMPVGYSGGVWSVAFNGVNGHYRTAALAAPGVDGVQFFAGVRKLTDVTGVYAEIGATGDDYGGGYLAQVLTKHETSVHGARGGEASDLAAVTAAGADSAVLTAIADINGGAATKLRRNGGAWQLSTNTTFGGGNMNPFGTLEINFGARSGGSIYTSAIVYGSLPIIRFSASPPTDAQIAAAEAFHTARLGA